MGLIVFGIKSFVQQALPAAAGCALTGLVGGGAYMGAKAITEGTKNQEPNKDDKSSKSKND